MLKQSTPKGCGLYAVSNALDLPESTLLQTLDLGVEGSNTGQLCAWLRSLNLQIYIEPVYVGVQSPNKDFHKLPFAAYAIKPDKGTLYLPVLVTVRPTKDKPLHMVSLKVFPDGTAHLFDSLKGASMASSLAELNNLYEDVTAMYVFANIESGEWLTIV